MSQNVSRQHGQIKVITFDLDDTFWDVTPVLMASEQKVFDWLDQNTPKLTTHFNQQQLRELRNEIAAKQPELTHQISQLRITALQKAMELAGYSKEFSRRCSLEAFDIFLKARHQVTFYETVTPMLKQLHGAYSLGVLTNGNANISRLEINPFFDFAFSAEQLNASKPSADHFQAALEISGANPKQIIHIGDHLEHDIEGALDFGCHAIWFNPGNLNQPSHINPTKTISCLSEIPAAIKAIELALS